MLTNPDLGLYIGRFQHIHIGHCSVIDTGLQICDRILVLVGSSQEYGTYENPYDIKLRIKLIEEIYGDRVIVKPISDLIDKHDMSSNWTQYLLNTVNQYMGKQPDVCMFGDEKVNGWFTDDEMRTTLRIVVPRALTPVSATQMRNWLIQDNKEEWHKYAHSKTHKHYSMLREIMLGISPAQSHDNINHFKKDPNLIYYKLHDVYESKDVLTEV
jgi:nicotinamide-nucleotide adenylyltransferase